MSAGSAGVPCKILLVDGTNSLYRAFFAIPPLRAPDGTPTNAAYGFVNMLSKVIREEAPDRVIVVFDARGPTFRHALYDAYKANREAQPEDLTIQLPIVRELVDAYRIPVVSVPNFEADDVIATLVERAPKDAQISIVSTDKDLMQLVSDRVTLLDGVKDRRYGPSEVEERFGVRPDRILDLRALIGDPSDNIPGVKGIGEKGAAKLIAEWGSLESLIEHRAEIKATRARNALDSQLEEARLSKRLATLRTDAPVPSELDEESLQPPDRDALRALFERLGFVRLVEAIDAEGDVAAPRRSETPVAVQRVEDATSLAAVLDELRALPIIPLICVLGENTPMSGSVVGLAFGLADDRAAYLAIGADSGELPMEFIVDRLRPLFEGAEARAWSACDAKQIQIVFGECGLVLPTPAFDLGISSQLLDS
ncbi:MAG: 5'-3' exonuclease H3TH domain-containing protein, partial [Myxococcota bacterium]